MVVRADSSYQSMKGLEHVTVLKISICFLNTKQANVFIVNRASEVDDVGTVVCLRKPIDVVGQYPEKPCGFCVVS